MEVPELLDALPYVDTAIDDDDELREMAMLEVDDEMEAYPIEKDYLEYLPLSEPRTFSTPLIEFEHSCIENKTIRPKSSELATQLANKVPPSADEPIESWNNSLNQLKIKLEYRQRQLTNLELIKIYNPTAWQQYISEHKNLNSAFEEELNYLDKKTQEVNWKRKVDQEHCYKRLQVLKDEWDNLVNKNHILAGEVKRLRLQLHTKT